MVTFPGPRARARGIGLCLLAVLAALASPAHAQADLSRARLATLKNGLRVLLVPDSTAVAVEVESWFAAGLADEKPGRVGISRLVAGLMARSPGSQDGARQVEAQGGNSGTFSSPDLACFYETLPAGSLELDLKLEAGRMKTLEAGAAALDAERARLAAERRGRAESAPGVRGLQRLYAALYPGHPYRLPTTGVDADLARLTERDVADQFRSRFAPDQALVTVVGRFEPDAALKLARSWLEPLPRRGTAAPAPSAPGPIRERRVSEPLDFNLRLLFVGWRAPGEGDPDAVALDALGRVLSGGTVARLPSEAVGPDRDLLFAQAGYDGRARGGLFYAYAALRPGADSVAVEKDLIARVEKLAGEPIAPEELERVKRQAEVAALFGWQAAHDRSLALGGAALIDGDYRSAWSRVDRVRALAAADLQRAAARTLKAETRAVLWLVPTAPAVAPPAARPKPGFAR